MPSDCLELPVNAGRKAIVTSSRHNRVNKSSECWGEPAGGDYIAGSVLSVVDIDISPPGCAGPPDPKRTTAYLDSGALATLLGAAAAADVAEI